MKLPIPSMHGLTTERLVFRTPSLADVDRWMPYHNDAGSIRFMPFTLGSREDCSYFIQRSLDRFERDGSGLYAIERHDGTLVGMIGLLTQTVDDLPELEIGYHLLPRPPDTAMPPRPSSRAGSSHRNIGCTIP